MISRPRIKSLRLQPRLFASKENLESLDDIMKDVETLLSDLDEPSTSDTGWRSVDWEHVGSSATSTVSTGSFKVASHDNLRPSCTLPSPVEKILVKDRIVYLKRDDLVRLPGSGVSGNKARKMYALNELPPRDFPACVVSYGGPQSNAMLALAAIVHSKNIAPEKPEAPSNDEQLATSNDLTTKRFVYYTKTLPRFLRNQPNGNLFRAQALGMELAELTHGEYNDLFGSESGGRPEPPAGLSPPVPGDSLWVPQGGACGVAVPGGRLLAQEIVAFWSQEGQGGPLSVCVPGGTCTTALLLHREIQKLTSRMKEPLDIRVVVIPCVGDDAYARRQMMALCLETGGSGDESEIPTVLLPAPVTGYFGQFRQEGYFTFGEPHADILQTFRAMEDECNVHLDLLFGAPSWNMMLRHWRSTLRSGLDFDERNPLAGRDIMYIHSGGLEGVASQLTRYKNKGLVELDDIQYPSRRIKSK
jgi:1-aminocyclopropane-1-carboxylate deaminase/D-cysteine desulfhydrase-like pyridoxal-dependent ACC family enzyme